MDKFSEKYINEHSKFAQLNIGFEFEFYTNKFSYYKLLEFLNHYLKPVRIRGFRRYHSDFKPSGDEWKIEPDLSGGSKLVELITSPMDYFEAKYYLVKVLKFIQDYGYTNDKCSLHINISFEEGASQSLSDLNILKHIISTDEEEIFSIFPSRKDNIYAKTIKKLIPFNNYDFSNVSVETIKNTLKVPNDKYYGINFININAPREEARLEYRYIGGKDYEARVGDILDLMNKFCLDVVNNTGEPFTNDEIDQLSEFLDDKIANFKNFITYDNFLVEFPKIEIQVDQITHYDIVSTYYPRMYRKLYALMEATEGLTECIINYFTNEQKIEVVGAEFKSILNISNFDFINCEITNGIFEKCTIVNSDMYNVDIKSCKLEGSNLDDSKLMNCNVQNSNLDDCLFVNGYLNGNMRGGIFRSGKIGPYGSLSETTKVVTGQESFFGTTNDEIEGDKKKKFTDLKDFK